ncbi:MAG: hypothetical protein RL637_681 [Pseudomonadota bacterium]
MKKKFITYCSIFIFSSTTGSVFAHTQTGTLATSASAVDLYSVSCSPDVGQKTAKLQTHIQGLSQSSGALKISVISQRFAVASRTTDVRNADGQFSPTATIAGSDGVYNVMVVKNSSGMMSYSVEFHCLSQSGAHTMTNSFLLQNQ